MASIPEDRPIPHPIDLLDLAHSIPEGKPVWAHESSDLNVNLISIAPGQGIASHVNAEVDVLLVGIEGAGSVDIDKRRHPVRAGHAVLIPKGSWRAIQCAHGHFAYLTCHRRRTGLMPARSRSRDDDNRRHES